MSNNAEVIEETIENSSSQKPEKNQEGRKSLRIIGFIFIGLSILLAIYGTVTLIAWNRGQVEKAQEEQTALEGELGNQMDLARAESVQGKNNLASRRLEWILERDPNYPGANELLAEVQSAVNKPATPTPMPRATNVPSANASPAADIAANEEFVALEKLIDEEQWDQAITAIIAYQSKYPNVRRQESDRLLYNAYLNLGQTLVMGDQVELGLFYFDQAEKLGDLPIEAEDQRTWADLYLLGISYYGIDWDTSLFYFRGLCAAAPYYQDSCNKLHGILIIYGDQYLAEMDYCPAEALYFEASRIDSDNELRDKIGEARELCAEATPTPTPTMTPTIPITGTETLESSLPVSIFAGS